MNKNQHQKRNFKTDIMNSILVDLNIIYIYTYFFLHFIISSCLFFPHSALVRSVIKNFTMAFFFPACLTVFIFQHNRAAYDILAKTIVVDARPNPRQVQPPLWMLMFFDQSDVSNFTGLGSLDILFFLWTGLPSLIALCISSAFIS